MGIQSAILKLEKTFWTREETQVWTDSMVTNNTMHLPQAKLCDCLKRLKSVHGKAHWTIVVCLSLTNAQLTSIVCVQSCVKPTSSSVKMAWPVYHSSGPVIPRLTAWTGRMKHSTAVSWAIQWSHTFELQSATSVGVLRLVFHKFALMQDWSYTRLALYKIGLV